MKFKIIIALASLFAMFSCSDKSQPSTPESEEDRIINELMAQCKDFEAKDIIQGLAGEWDEDSLLFYDEAWQKIDKYYMLMGKHYAIGLSEIRRFTFTSDGKGFLYVLSQDGSEYLFYFDWQYNTEKHNLILSGDWNYQYKVSGFNNGYIVLDRISSDGDNIREVLKRKVTQ